VHIVRVGAVNPTRYLQTALNKFAICRRQFKSTRATVVVADLSHIVGKTASEPRMCIHQGSLQQTSYTTAQHTPRPYQGTDYYLGTSSIVSNIRNARTFSTIHSCVPIYTVFMHCFYGQSSSVLHPALALALWSNVYLNLRAFAGSLRSVCSTESGTITTRRKFLRATGSPRSSTFEPRARFLSSKGFDVG
jgi:hypothetical protein